jgi:ribosomal protein S17E
MDHSKLVPGQRYLFHYTSRAKSCEKLFRANFLGLVVFNKYTTLVLNKYESNKRTMTKCIHYVASELIENYETLVTIMENSPSSLPDDMLMEINNYW